VVIVKFLKRKDAVSVVVAIVVALIVGQMLNTIVGPWANRLSSVGPHQNVDWHNQYLFPLVAAALQLLLLEVLGWVYVGLNSGMKKK
jgi:hypothetical protein